VGRDRLADAEGRRHEALLTVGQLAGAIKEILPVAEIMCRLIAETEAALAKMPGPS
jgi:NAD(P)H-dependent flavin oxidoreductase YrpB (nitropropane dioxygenase family)